MHHYELKKNHTASFIQVGAEPTDTFQISIPRRRGNLSCLVGRGPVEERTPLVLSELLGPYFFESDTE